MEPVSTDLCSLRIYREGKTIFKEGERGNCAYVVIEGALEIFKGIGTCEVELTTCGAGALFGEMALIDDAGRSATARAKTHTKCLVFPKDRFRQFFDETDPFVRGLLRTRYARATCGTIRLNLVKIAALVRISVRRIRFAMPSAFPYQAAFAAAHQRLSTATA